MRSSICPAFLQPGHLAHSPRTDRLEPAPFWPGRCWLHHDTSQNQESAGPSFAPPQTTLEPSKLAQWREFHEQVEALPTDEQEVFNLLWYQGLSQAEAAALLNMSERTLQRRWQAARLKIFDALNGYLPE